jgi:hypothetical protein
MEERPANSSSGVSNELQVRTCSYPRCPRGGARETGLVFDQQCRFDHATFEHTPRGEHITRGEHTPRADRDRSPRQT